MDIAGLSMNLAQTQLLSNVGTAVLSQSLEHAKDLTANMVEMLDAAAMERSVNPDIGGSTAQIEQKMCPSYSLYEGHTSYFTLI